MLNIPEYNVECRACGSVWSPSPRSELWHQAKHRADQGFLDACLINGEKCGCVKQISEPDAPYRVTGYTDDCRDFDIPFTTFTGAARRFLDEQRHGSTVFIIGVSAKVAHRLAFG